MGRVESERRVTDTCTVTWMLCYICGCCQCVESVVQNLHYCRGVSNFEKLQLREIRFNLRASCTPMRFIYEPSRTYKFADKSKKKLVPDLIVVLQV